MGLRKWEARMLGKVIFMGTEVSKSDDKDIGVDMYQS
jgi:hypothetical protein